MIDWQTIDTVLLDMDGTLLDLHFDHYFWFHHLPERYAQAHGISAEEAQEYLVAKIREYEGTLQWYCLDHWSQLTQMDMAQLKGEIRHKIKVRPFAEQFLIRLKDMGKKLVLITNSHPIGLEIKLDVTNIDKWLDIVISSHEFQTPKEEQAFWHQLIEKESFDRSRTIFIDDTPRILRSAQTFGIEHLVCITSPDSMRPSHLPEEFLGIEHFEQIMP
ncbi:GMP/IMP nucleotidase [Agarilytica rhodophyticola]|uniref:GMP/IMP nucleotidase n=1 Tax=Agarilytica rhodophyticola TaxID=1737490 RepID=UPI000B347913|nr:GMP/IMP nucleotidase [Agarilytica rhodophyticola]